MYSVGEGMSQNGMKSLFFLGLQSSDKKLALLFTSCVTLIKSLSQSNSQGGGIILVTLSFKFSRKEYKNNQEMLENE